MREGRARGARLSRDCIVQLPHEELSVLGRGHRVQLALNQRVRQDLSHELAAIAWIKQGHGTDQVGESGGLSRREIVRQVGRRCVQHLHGSGNIANSMVWTHARVSEHARAHACKHSCTHTHARARAHTHTRTRQRPFRLMCDAPSTWRGQALPCSAGARRSQTPAPCHSPGTHPFRIQRHHSLPQPPTEQGATPGTTAGAKPCPPIASSRRRASSTLRTLATSRQVYYNF